MCKQWLQHHSGNLIAEDTQLQDLMRSLVFMSPTQVTVQYDSAHHRSDGALKAGVRFRRSTGQQASE